MDRTAHLFLHRQLLARAEAGGHRLINRLGAALEQAGWTLKLQRETPASPADAAARNLFAIHHMAEPEHARGLCLRQAYMLPFWRIERTNRRWDFEVAREAFDPSGIPADEARAFARKLARKHLGAAETPRGNSVYVALQGRILLHRSFQSASPLEMIRSTLEHAGDRPIVLGLHPNETYTKPERAALEPFEADARVTVGTGGMEQHLAACDYLVTENSAVALMAMLWKKPAVRFAGIDFHHITIDAGTLGARAAFARVASHAPDYERYLLWFFRSAIDASSDGAEAQILAALRRNGWPL